MMSFLAILHLTFIVTTFMLTSQVITEDLPTINDPFSQDSNCGMRPRSVTENKIIGGIGVSQQWPWIAALYLKPDSNVDPPGTEPGFICGSTIISPGLVLTAAHCVSQYKAIRYEVHIGITNLTQKNPRVVRVVRIMKEAAYDPAKIYKDIAILQLAVRLPFNQNAAAVCLPYGDWFGNNDFVGWNATVLGWGSLRFGGTRVNQLQEVRIPVISPNSCEAAFDLFFKDKKAEFDANFPDGFPSDPLCAGLLDKGGKDSCQGDSGGPMTVQLENGRHVLIGIVSFGIFCGRPGLPGMYTRVTDYLQWITDRTTAI